VIRGRQAFRDYLRGVFDVFPDLQIQVTSCESGSSDGSDGDGSLFLSSVPERRVRNGSATPRVGGTHRKAEHPAVFGSRIHATPETLKGVSAYAGQQMMAAKREL